MSTEPLELAEVPARPDIDPPTEEVPTPPMATGRRRRRMVVLLVVAVLLVAGGATALGLWLSSGNAPAAGLTFTDTDVTVGTGTIQQTVAASGTLEPAQSSDADFAVSGTVTAVDVKPGQVVTAGQVLATVDPSALQADVAAAQANLDAARARLSSDESSGAAASQVDSDEASVTSAQSQLTSANTDLADASLTAPIAGTVASVNLSVGQQVSGSGGGGTGSGGSGGSGVGAGGSGGTGETGSGGSGGTGSSGSSTAQVSIISTSAFNVATTVDDTQIGQIQLGDQAVITPTGSSTPVYGTVTGVDLEATDTSGVADFPVTIGITGSPSGLFAGATAEVSIIVQQLNNVVEVPTAAITYANGSAQVTVVGPGGAHVVTPVTVGASSTTTGETQITHGVRAGQKIIERVAHFTLPSGVGGSGSPFGRRFTGGGGFPGGGTFTGGGGGGFGGGGFGGGGFGG